MSVSVDIGRGVRIGIPEHQAGNKPKYVPKISYLPVRSGDTTAVWRSSGTFLEFQLPKRVGILRDVRLRFNVTNNTGDALEVPPTPFWVSQIEVYIGTQQVETLYPNDIFNETVGFMSNDETNAKNEILGVNTPTTPYGYSAPTGAGTYYLPFNNALTSCRLYVAGCDEDVTYKVYFPPSMFPSTFTMSNVQLEILEDVPVDPSIRQQLAAKMKERMAYSIVVRNRQQGTTPKADLNSDMTVDLTGIKGRSAGLIVYANVSVQPGTGTVTNPTGGAAVPANAQLGYRFPITTLELQDQMGNKRTETLQGAAQNSFVWWDHVGTEFASNVNGSTYLIPFSTHFKSAVLEGANYGSIDFDGEDRLVLTAPWAKTTGAAPSSESWVITVTNYTYHQLLFENNKLKTIQRR